MNVKIDLLLASKDGGLLLVLNAHATMLAKGKTPSHDLISAFDSFITNVEKHWPQRVG